MIWTPVADDPGYEVSDEGTARGIDRWIVTKAGVRKFYRGRELKCTPYKDGYRRVKLPRHGNVKIAILMLESFVGPKPFPEAMARHLDDVKHHDRLDNLAWGSESDNARDRVRNGKHHQSIKTACPWGHDYVPENIYRNKTGGRVCKRCANGERGVAA